MFSFKKKEKIEVPLQIPKHIGIIMDGNGRWAKKRMQPRVFGHKSGMETLQNVTIAAKELGVQVLTVYAFSTENWSRPQKEVSFIMNLPVEFYGRYVPELHRNKAEELTRLNTGLILNFALNYGGRAEIVQAVKMIAQDVLDAKFSPGEINEEMIANYLQTSNLPRLLRDPDLIIRTSGEVRLSNFLPWQSAFSELYFTDILWPDFNEKALKAAIEEYSKRNRRFGGV